MSQGKETASQMKEKIRTISVYLWQGHVTYGLLYFNILSGWESKFHNRRWGKWFYFDSVLKIKTKINKNKVNPEKEKREENTELSFSTV